MERKRYTKEEEVLIAEEIANNPTNIVVALKIAANKLGRTYGGVSWHWYNVQSKNNKNAIFLIASPNNTVVNRKCTNELSRYIHNSSTTNIFRRILRMIGFNK